MGIADRMAEIFTAKANAALDRAEDPRELLDYSYTLQRNLLADVRRGLVDVATARERTEQWQEELRTSAHHLQDKAEKVLAAGHPELAREALAERTRLLDQADALAERQSTLRAEEDRLTAASQRLQGKIEEFGHRKESLKARYTLAEAESYVDEMVAGLSGDMTGAGAAARRAQDRSAHHRVRADALDELLESGALREALLDVEQEPVPPDLHARLDEAITGAAVDEELGRMKAGLHERDSSVAEPRPPSGEGE
ncbi:PspA/IM30 family protein [Actinomadura viridis]|uniref:Phage shock protein A n=1 Tax=Actinomadura viridis TaxID=58110 RepID=A0A931DG72_9ACTN|nr:PspA/IM30 family protein [Actinomadura viridis]MBG6086906.1 phage shock protein A [Actinomadura viridis]